MLTFLKYVFARKNLVFCLKEIVTIMNCECNFHSLQLLKGIIRISLFLGLCSTTLNLTTDKTKRAHFFSLLDDWFGISVKGIQVISDLYFQ